MASIITEKNGLRRLQFTDSNKIRRGFRLGRIPLATAKEIRRRVELLLSAKISGQPLDRATAEWLFQIGATLYKKLCKVGLAQPRTTVMGDAIPRLGPFLRSYMEGRTDIKPRTRLNLEQVQSLLIDHFGTDRPLASITAGDGIDFRRTIRLRLGENSVRRHCGRVRQFFAAAVDKQLIELNPLAKMKDLSVRENKERFYFVTQDEAEKVLKACPDVQWRLMFALARYGGLRCPSELMQLRWCDVDWDRGRLLVHSPKTEHHIGKATRLVPLFPEVRAPLQEMRDQAPPEAEFVVPRCRDVNVNLRTQLSRIIERAGLKIWPKLWQNLRSTRQTELAETFPAHVICEWIGNSEAVARRHYLQVTDAHYERALGTSVEKSGAKMVQPVPATSRQDSPPVQDSPGIRITLDNSQPTHYPGQGSNLRPLV